VVISIHSFSIVSKSPHEISTRAQIIELTLRQLVTSPHYCEVSVRHVANQSATQIQTLVATPKKDVNKKMKAMPSFFT